jgi:hypothetical protein
VNAPGLIVHASVVALALDADGPLFGLALTGPPGAGKSRLAAELIAGCAHRRSRLLADDAVLIHSREGRLVASAPPSTSGTIEVFGTGLARTGHAPPMSVKAAAALAPEAERLPPEQSWAPLGPSGPRVPLYKTRGSAAGLVLFLRSVTSGHSRTAGHDAVPVIPERP